MFSKEEVFQILKTAEIPIIDSSINYWFLRTNGGDNFENFYFGNYIAIGWDKINDLDLIHSCTFDEIKQDVIQLYPEDSKPGSTASQILRFVREMKPGDYVLIPGTNCDRIAIGRITSDAYIHEPTAQEKFNVMFYDEEIGYLKRRTVEWISDRPFERYELDPMLIPIIYSYGTIVDANPYSEFINRTLYNCYVRGDEIHAIFDVNRTGNIPAVDFYNFMNSIFESIDIYSEIFNTTIDKNELSIKATINSAGPIEIITYAVSGFIALSSLALFINGAKVNFSFDIFNLFKGNIDIDSPGLVDKLNDHKKISDENQVKLKKAEAKINESKEKLQIKKKKNKK